MKPTETLVAEAPTGGNEPATGVQNGVDQQRFEALFRRVFPRLVSIGVVYTGRLDSARRLAHLAMRQVQQRWDTIGDDASAEPWCIGVMANLLIDNHFVGEQRNGRLRWLRNARQRSVSVPSVDEWNELLHSLTDRQRLIVTLYFVLDWSSQDIASSLDITEAAVRTTLFEARERLRRAMAWSEHDDR